VRATPDSKVGGGIERNCLGEANSSREGQQTSRRKESHFAYPMHHNALLYLVTHSKPLLSIAARDEFILPN
jgi:hypothetical protein